jgi:hypothetical protein
LSSGTVEQSKESEIARICLAAVALPGVYPEKKYLPHKAQKSQKKTG